MWTDLKTRLAAFLPETLGKRRSMSLVWLVLNMLFAPAFALVESPFPYPWLYLTVSGTFSGSGHGAAKWPTLPHR